MKEFRVGYPKVFIAAIYIYNVYCSCVCTLSRLCVCSNIQKYTYDYRCCFLYLIITC